jgi:hypothetical protein
MRRLLVIFLCLCPWLAFREPTVKALAVEEATSTATAVVPTPVPDVYTGAPPEFLYPGMLPDHPLYFLKDLYYRLRTKLVFGLENQANWYLKLADKRAAEVRELAKKGKVELATRATEKAAKMHDIAVAKMKKLGAEKTPVELTEKLKKVTLRQRVTLENFLERVPLESKQTVGEAIEASKQRLKQILEVLGEPIVEPSPTPVKAPDPLIKINEDLQEQIRENPEDTFEVQVKLASSFGEENKDELEELLDATSYTEKFAVGEATGDSIIKLAILSCVDHISFVPKAEE